LAFSSIMIRGIKSLTACPVAPALARSGVDGEILLATTSPRLSWPDQPIPLRLGRVARTSEVAGMDAAEHGSMREVANNCRGTRR
jgi:hypothetical protein